MSVTCLIKYEITRSSRRVREYADRWAHVIPRCGGDLGRLLSSTRGDHQRAWALITFRSLAAYETYRPPLRADNEGARTLPSRNRRRFILERSGTFLEPSRRRAAFQRPRGDAIFQAWLSGRLVPGLLPQRPGIDAQTWVRLE